MPPSAQAQAYAYLSQLLPKARLRDQVQSIQRLMEQVQQSESTALEVLQAHGQPLPPPSVAVQMERMGRPDPNIPSGFPASPPVPPTPEQEPRYLNNLERAQPQPTPGVVERPPSGVTTPSDTVRRRSLQTDPAPGPIPTPAAGDSPDALQYQQRGQLPFTPQGLFGDAWGSDPETAEDLLSAAHFTELLDLPALGYEIKRGFKPFVKGMIQTAKKEGKKLTLKALRPYLIKKIAKAGAGSALGPAGTALGLGSTAWDALKLGGRLLKGGWKNIPQANRLQQVGRAFSMPIAATAGAARIGEGALSGDPLGVGLGVGEIGLGVGLPLVGSGTRLAQAGRRLAGELGDPVERTLARISGTPSPTAATAEAQLLRRIEGIQGARDAQLPRWPRPLSEAAADTPDPTPPVEPPIVKTPEPSPVTPEDVVPPSPRQRREPSGASGERVVEQAQQRTPPPGEVPSTTRVTDLGLTVPAQGKDRGAFRKVLKEVVAAAEPEQAGRGLGKSRLNAIIRQAQKDATGNSQASQWVKEALAIHYNVTPDELVRPRAAATKTPPVDPVVTGTPESPGLQRIPYSADPKQGTAAEQEAWRVAKALVVDEWHLVDPTGPQGKQNVNRLAHQILTGDFKEADLSPEDMRTAQQAILDRLTATKTPAPVRGVDPVEPVTAAKGDPIPEGFEHLALPKGAASVGHETGLFERARETVADTFGMSISTKPRGNTALNQLTGQILTRPEDLQQATLRNQIIRDVLGEDATVKAPKASKVPKVRAVRTAKGPGEVGEVGEVVEEVTDSPVGEASLPPGRVAATTEQLDELDTGFEQLATDLRNLLDEELPEELADVRGEWDEALERAIDRTRLGVEGAQHPQAATVAARTRLLDIAEEVIEESDALDTEVQASVSALRSLHDEVGQAMESAPAPTGQKTAVTGQKTTAEAKLQKVPDELTAADLTGRSKKARANVTAFWDAAAPDGNKTKELKQLLAQAKKGDEQALRQVSTLVARSKGTAAVGQVPGPETQLGLTRPVGELPKTPAQYKQAQERAQFDLQARQREEAAVAGAEEAVSEGVVLSDVPTLVGKLKSPKEAVQLQLELHQSIRLLKQQLAGIDQQLGDLPALPEFYQPGPAQVRAGQKTQAQQQFDELLGQKVAIRQELSKQLMAERGLQRDRRESTGLFFTRTRAGDLGSDRKKVPPDELPTLNPSVPFLSDRVAERLRSIYQGPSASHPGETQADVLLDAIRRYAESVHAGFTGGKGGIESAAHLLRRHFENLALHLVDKANESGRVVPRVLDPPEATEATLGRKPYTMKQFWGEGLRGIQLSGWPLPPARKTPVGKNRRGRDLGFGFFDSFEDDTEGAVQAVADAQSSLRRAFHRIQQAVQAKGECPQSVSKGSEATQLWLALDSPEAPPEGKRIWAQFVRMHWARNQAAKADALMEAIYGDPAFRKGGGTLPEPFEPAHMDAFDALYEGSINEVTRWANAMATSQLTPLPGGKSPLKWKESTKAGGLLRQEKGARAHPKLWAQDIDTPRANLTAWRMRDPSQDVSGGFVNPKDTPLTLQRLGEELDTYLQAVNHAVEGYAAIKNNEAGVDLAMNLANIPAHRVGQVLSGGAGGAGGLQQAETLIEEQGLEGPAAGAARVALGTGGAAFGAALPSYLAPRVVSAGKAGVKGAVQVGSLMMNWLLSSPRSILKAWMGAHNGTLYVANERMLEGLFDQLGAITQQRTATTKKQRDRAIQARTQGKALVKDGWNIIKGVAEEDLRFATSLVPFLKSEFGKKSLIRQIFGIDITAPEGKQAMKSLSAQFSAMTDEEFEALLETDRLDGRLSNAVIGKLFRSADWAFQNIMAKNNIPFEKARQATLTGKLDTKEAQRAMDMFQPPEGPQSVLGTAAKKVLSPVPRVGLQALERGIERTLAPVHYLGKRAMGAPQVRPGASPFGKLTPRSIPDALAKLTGAGASTAAGTIGYEHLNPRLQPFFAAAMGPGAIPAAAAAGVAHARHAGTNPVTGAVSRVLQEGLPLDLESQNLNIGNLPGEFARRAVVPSIVRDWAQIGDMAAAEGRVSSGPQLAAALEAGGLDLQRPGGELLGATLAQKGIGPMAGGVLAELMLASPYHRRTLPPKPLVSHDIMGRETFSPGGMPGRPTIPLREEGWQTLRQPSVDAQVAAATELIKGPQSSPQTGVLDTLKRIGGEAVGRSLFPTYQSMRPVAPEGTDPVLQELATWGAADLVEQAGLPGFRPPSTTGGGVRDPATGLPTTVQRRGRELAAEVAGQTMAGVYRTVQALMASGDWAQLTPQERRWIIGEIRGQQGALSGSGTNAQQLAALRFQRPQVNPFWDSPVPFLPQ